MHKEAKNSATVQSDQTSHIWSDLNPHISTVPDAETKLKAVGLAGLQPAASGICQLSLRAPPILPSPFSSRNLVWEMLTMQKNQVILLT